MWMKDRGAQPVLETIRAKAGRKRDREVVWLCDRLLEEAAEEVRDHKRLKRFFTFGPVFTLASTGPLGRAVLLLYCQNLFLDPQERLHCVLSSFRCVRQEDLDDLAAAAAKVRSFDLSPLQDKAIFHLLRRVCTTPYFLKENVKTTSRVLSKLREIEQARNCWSKLTSPVARVYAAGYLHYHPKHGRKLDFDNAKPARYSLRLDPAELLACLRKSTELTMLVTKRTSKSLLPHGEAAMVCIEHALMWLNAPNVNVFYPLKLTYGDLSGASLLSENDRISFFNHWDVRIPSYLDRAIRHSVFESYSCDAITGEKVHFLKPEDYKRSENLVPCLRQHLSKKQLKVFRTLPFAYRSLPEELEHNRLKTCKVYAEICKEVMPLEPPQYCHLYE